MRLGFCFTVCVLAVVAGLAPLGAAAPPRPASELDRLIDKGNAGQDLQVAPILDDLPFLRRVTIDLIGRIPNEEEIQQYLSWPAAERRGKAVDALMKDPRFVDRWAIFFADMFRIRSNVTGGSPLYAFMHRALESNMPYDEMCRKLISATGRPETTGEAGFILGDDADPMALTGITSQVFLGVRIACAQCHNHPFDVWTRKQFYGLAAYFGKTRRVESRLTKTIYSTEEDQNVILWPPEDKSKGKTRAGVKPEFPFAMDPADKPGTHISRFEKLRAEQEAKLKEKNKPKEVTVDDLIGEGSTKTKKKTGDDLDVLEEARREARALDVQKAMYRASELRQELGKLVTDPRNRYFSRNLVNRVWAELVGYGFVNAVDDFRADNPPVHPQAMDYLADEFVGAGFDYRTVVKLVVTSQAYQRAQLPGNVTAVNRQKSEKAFVAAPARRMLSEVLYDSIVQAGHLFDVKHRKGENLKKVQTIVREAVEIKDDPKKPKKAGEKTKKAAMKAPAQVVRSGYDLENALDLAIDAKKLKEDLLQLEMMKKVSNEELEAEAMVKESSMRFKYVERVVETEIDDNPRFMSSMKMASPAPAEHFLRVFGQPARDAVGDHRDHSPSMRQALMMLNGKLTHEASRVGAMEEMHGLLAGPKPDWSKAVQLAYLQILTREPTKEEVAEAQTILKEAASPLDGMADLRWALLNSHEFRFIP